MIHLQATVPGWLQAVQKLPAGSLVKAVDQVQELKNAKLTNPGVVTCLRHHYDHGQVFGGDYETNKARAREFFLTFVDGTFMELAQYVDYIEEFNEYLANSQNSIELADRVRWATACADVWKNEFRKIPALSHIRLVLCNTAIGNWIDKDFAVVARNYDALIGYHPYTLWERGVRWSGDWGNLSGLWDTMEYDWGLEVDWLFTEAGPFQAAEDGWKSSNCLGNDRTKYVTAVKEWIADVRETPAFQDGRVKGFCLFTTGRAGATWASFWTEQPELNMLADVVAQEWRVPEPPVEPPEPPEPEVPYVVVVNLLSQSATIDDKVYVLEHTHEKKETILQSADDAARLVAPGRLGSKVKVWNPGEWNGDIIRWLNDRSVNNVEPHYIPNKVAYLSWPVVTDNKSINHPFGEKRSYGPHEGIDLYAELGDPIVACASGKVVWASNQRRSGGDSLYGNHIIIEHKDGWFTWYGHLSKMLVRVGDYVLQNGKIGEAGSTGNSTGPHLHLSVQHIGHGLSGFVLPDVVDPAPLLGK